MFALAPARAGRRELAKEERRARIAAAARALMGQVGVEALSMRQVAVRAGVSLSTVYNLFESKEAVLTRLFNEAFERYRAEVFARASEDALRRFFDAIDIAAEFYAADEAFYRSSVWLVGPSSALKASLQQPRIEFFSDLVDGAVASGQLRGTLASQVLGPILVPMFSTPYQAWAAGLASLEEFRARAKLGIAAVLRAFAEPPAQPALDALLRDLEISLGDAAGGARGGGS